MSEQHGLETQPTTPRRSATLAYTAARLVVFVVVLGVLWLVRVRGPLLVVLALAVSGLVSFVLLRHQRVAMGAEIHRRVATIKARSAERTAREDAAVDEMLEQDGSPEDGLPYGGVGAGKTGSERT